MKFTLTIETGNAGMTDDPYIATADALRNVANRVCRDGLTSGVVSDINGNKVGEFQLTIDRSDD